MCGWSTVKVRPEDLTGSVFVSWGYFERQDLQVEVECEIPSNDDGDRAMSKYELVERYYGSGIWYKEKVRNDVKKGRITAEEYQRSIDFSFKWKGGHNFSVINGRPVIKGVPKTTPAAQLLTELVGRHSKQHTRLALFLTTTFAASPLTSPNGGFALILQRAAIDCGQSVVVDGKFRPKTFVALKACGPLFPSMAIYKQRKRYYEKIVAQSSVFLKGWMLRADDMARTAGVIT